jgi:hypothetical protein
MVQSAAVTGALAGALAVPALALDPTKHAEISVLVGLNGGLLAGLAAAYLPDQRTYGPTWQRVMMVDLAGAAGLFAGALTVTVGHCINENIRCERFASDVPTGRGALVGAGLGLAAGWFLTRHYDKIDGPVSEARTARLLLPLPAPLATIGRNGQVTLLPGPTAQGRF